jgi:hypothetical protein
MLANSSTFTFNGQTYLPTSVIVQSKQPEVVNMTSITATLGTVQMVSTGDYTAPATIEIEALATAPAINEQGAYTFATPGGTFSGTAVCSQRTVDTKVGDLIRTRFTLTVL